MGSLVKKDFNRNGVTTVQLDRADKRNALSQALIDELIGVIRDAECDDNTRVVVLAGTPGGAFSAGADIEELSVLDPATAHARGWLKDLSDAIQGMRKPIVAAVEGIALGGGFELALLCDIIYASSSARFGLPEVKISTIPGMGGTQRLTRAIGKQRAMALILTGDMITSEEAERLGIVSKRVEEVGGTLKSAQELAARIASLSAPVIRSAKQGVLAAESSVGLDGFGVERSLYYDTFALEDFKIGTKAFLQKRKAEITHR